MSQKRTVQEEGNERMVLMLPAEIRATIERMSEVNHRTLSGQAAFMLERYLASIGPEERDDE